MTVTFDEVTQVFHLSNQKMSYIMEIKEPGFLLQVYYGKKISRFDHRGDYPEVDRSSFSPNPPGWKNREFSLDTALQEIPGQGTSDYRESLFEIVYPDGSSATSFVYQSHHIYQGKPKLAGLPATYVDDKEEAETLEIVMVDPFRQVEAILVYTIYRWRSVLTKSVRYRNLGEVTICLNRGMSACVDFDDDNFEMIQLPGAWAREKHIERQSIGTGIKILDSKRGASSVTQQPFMALVRPETDEHQGEAYGFHFIYSGNFSIRTEVDPFCQTRVLVGINPSHFSWQLEPLEMFQTPEVVLVYSNEGLNGMSQTFHHLYRERLARGKFQYQQRPILINNWESTYFDFDETKLIELAESSAELGIELLVLDDGWFGKRNDDKSSLGDWYVNQQKLPRGLASLAKAINDKGVKFGLWFEPEMISEDSDLFRQHPDWHLHVPGLPSSQGRDQHILDVSREDVRDYLFVTMVKLLNKAPIEYIKWDMNRNMTEIYSLGRPPQQQQETAHRYILGLYDLLERLTNKYPDILFENCSGGAGRYDPGMVYYMPQSWASDNTDAIERIKIQYGTSLVFPPIMSCAHLSESPNHQVGRLTSFESRSAVAMSGNFGVMMDVTQKTASERKSISKVISFYKQHRHLIQFGEFYRLLSPFEHNDGAWLFVSENQDHALFFYFEILSQATKPFRRVKLAGLDPDAEYLVENVIRTGEELMNYGLYVNYEMQHDFSSKVIDIRRSDSDTL
ncbi:alpha-galactosidase [Vagococcus sp. BWB3-3]|uniref:Alpha-galactosidase n=1 Tax=Vagococcus allomyrinae TaxID=2794353 RepID=A0A940P3Q6_9ENTE|nr:alpha-galactosidase [Vagococcus allomyrinae]MBP1040897.1 alpha-galactosidase [Vagococcus allomyrinae]